MAPELANFCGFNLKHGTVIIGVLQSILAFMAMILTAAYAEHPHELVQMTDPSIVPDYSTLKLLLMMISVAAAIQCVLSILIIFGAETNRPSFLLPWLIYNPIGVIFYIITVFMAILYHADDQRMMFIIIHLALGAAITLIASYKILAVYSYYRYLKSLNF